MEHLQGKLYHMISVTNLRGIFTHRTILSKEYLEQQGVSYSSIANDEVQQLRDRIFIWDASLQKFRPLHSYVPFYFATHTPMLYVQFKDHKQESIVLLEASRSLLQTPGALFTDGNASMQQLSQYGNEIVQIMPATRQNPNCRRRYLLSNAPIAPKGTNPSCSNFYSDVSLLDKLDWAVINDRDFATPEKKRIKHSEVLIPASVPLEKIEGILVMSQSMVQDVNTLINTHGLANAIPQAKYRRDLFF